jgi:hypothetical protein
MVLVVNLRLNIALISYKYTKRFTYNYKFYVTNVYYGTR